MPATPQATVIRHNVFSKGANSSRGELARPNVLVGHWPLRGLGKDDRYLVHSNFFYQNPSESLFQGEGNIALYHNLMVNDNGDAVRIQPHHNRPRNIQILFNTVVAKGAGVTLLRRSKDPKPQVRISGNIVMATPPLVGHTHRENLTNDYLAAARHLVAPGAPLPSLDLHLRTTGQPSPFAALDQQLPLPDFEQDFDGLTHQGTSAGAYGAPGVNSGWQPQLTRKPDLP